MQEFHNKKNHTNYLIDAFDYNYVDHLTITNKQPKDTFKNKNKKLNNDKI